MTINDADQFALLKVIGGLKEQVHKTPSYGDDGMKELRNDFFGMLEQLTEVVQELHKEELTAVE